MRVSLDNEFALHGAALALESQRSEILAGNLANIETPGYQARDIDYQSIMQSVAHSLQTTSTSTSTTAQTTPAGSLGSDDLLYRIPYQTTQDGNTAELGPEQTRFDQNAMAFKTSLRFMNYTIAGIKEAISGDKS